MPAGLQLGPPGVYLAPDRVAAEPDRVRLDITGFVGIARCGPVNTPVRVTSWSDFQRRFGDPPGPVDPPYLLAHAVNSYFAQGGAVAWVLRVAPSGDPGPATATLRSATGLVLRAADEGSWGNGLTATVSFDVAAEFSATPVDGGAGLEVSQAIPRWSALRVRTPGDVEWRWAVSVAGNRVRLDRPVPPGRVSVGVVTGRLDATDGTRSEQLSRLGLHPDHPRYLARIVNGDADDPPSLLVRAENWVAPVAPEHGMVVFGPAGPAVTDRWAQIDGGSFFDTDDVRYADPAGTDDDAHRGVDRMAGVTEIGLLCVPDLAWSWHAPPAPRADPGYRVGSCCAPDEPPVVPMPVERPDTRLDPNDAADLEELVARQQRVAGVAADAARFVALLDVPYGLADRSVPIWRARFDTSYVAAYHPWLGVVPAGRTDVVWVPPSSFAAGVTARRERALGLQWGPANVLAADAVAGSAPVPDPAAATLYQLGINLFRAERDGFRLVSARTLAADPQYRQLSVRRLMTYIRLSLVRLGEHLVFEPGTDILPTAVRQRIGGFLDELFRGGAFAGTTAAESYFVHCDGRLDDAASRAAGRLVAEVGVAPVSPIEFLVVRLVVGTDGTTTTEL